MRLEPSKIFQDDQSMIHSKSHCIPPMHQTPHHISDTKSESFREHPLALETVVKFHFLSQHRFFRLIIIFKF